jgi:hypothetical protein
MLGEGALHGRQRIEVRGQAVKNVAFGLHQSGKLEGHLSFAGEPAEPGCYSGASVTLDPLDAVMPALNLGTAANAKGEFTVKDVAPASYHVKVALQGSCFVREVRLNGKTVSDRVAVIEGNEVLSVILTVKGGSVAGTVRVGAGAAVILAPESAGGEVWVEEAQLTHADDHGHYRFEQAAPGRYRAMALAAVAPYQYEDPMFWTDHKDQTASVTLEPTGSAKCDLQILLPKDDWK